MYCRCERCETARKRGGHELRTRASTLVDGQYLIDAGPDSYSQFVREGLSHRDLRACFHTHSHDDHFLAEVYRRRYPVYAGGIIEAKLTVVGNSSIQRSLESRVVLERAGIEFLEAQPFSMFQIDHLQVCALPANHALKEGGLLYHFADGNSHFLCANDTGYFLNETWQYLVRLAQPLDLVVMDGTWIDNNRGSDHMDLEQNRAVRGRMLKEGIANERTRFVLTHIGHFSSFGHAELASLLPQMGLEPGFDGMCVQL